MSIFSRKTEVQEPLMDHTIYLIDSENVRTVWTLLLDRMSSNDKIYVFYTANSGNVSYEDLNGVISSGKNVELIQCHTGKNGLDFQLVSYLGYLIRNNENADYCIISDDSGYDAVIKFWEDRDVDVTRKTAFQVSGKQGKAPKKSLFGVKPKPKTAPPAKNGLSPNAVSSAGRSKPGQNPNGKSSQAQNPGVKNQQAANTPASNGSHPGQSAPYASKTSSGYDSTEKSDSSYPAVKAAVPAEFEASSMEAKVSELLPGEPAERVALICDIIRTSGGKSGLADIHDEIEKIYRNERATEVYRIIRHNINGIYV